MSKLFSTAAIAALLAFTLPVGVTADALAREPLKSETYKQLDLFADVFERVRSEYVEEVTDEQLIEAAIDGMLTSLDPHSSYLNKKNFADMRVQTRGEFGGLGIEVTTENGFVKVISPMDDTPAARAGVQPGDFITHLNEEPIVGLSLNEAVEKMRGPVGSDIKVTIRRASVAEPIQLSLTRASIKVQSVRFRAEQNVGYIRISSFNEQTQPGLDKAMAKLKEQMGTKLSAMSWTCATILAACWIRPSPSPTRSWTRGGRSFPRGGAAARKATAIPPRPVMPLMVCPWWC